MNTSFLRASCLFFFMIFFAQSQAQNTSGINLVAQPIPDRTVFYSIADSGVSKPIIWGLDLAWLSESNLRRGMAFMGIERVDVIRASFQPTHPLANGDLQAPQINDLNTRLNLIALTNPQTKVVLNCDHPSVDSWYAGNAARWAQLMDVTTRRVQERGRTVAAISPFNEPDYGWGQGTITDFFNIAGELRKNTRFDSIRISGGNTLNCDQALPWYNQLKTRLDEGNTHQLAGSFDNYANFYKTVRSNGHHGTNDELHNVMEAMVGVEYGMQTGIWWGTAELARGEFVKASYGKRLGYAEHRPNWTAASVYRNPDGQVQAFGGTSERQAATTTYRFVSKDKDVFYDGNGPQREYTMVLPGGTGYQKGQTNAERVVNITWGDDIQPVINGHYVLVNRNSGKIMEVYNGLTNAGANIQQNNYLGSTHQQWNVTPVTSRVGGDFSYFTITAVHSNKAIDVYNWSLSNGGNLVVWDDAKSGNQQWYLDYAGDEWFYIRSRHSAKCIDVANASTANGANIQQWDKNGETNQHWRFLPVDALIEFVPPAAPTNLVATPNNESIRLDWQPSPDSDVAGYTIFRSDSMGGPYNTLARQVKTTTFVDNSATTTTKYYYTVKAVDKSLNHSGYSNEAAAAAIGNNELMTRLTFDGNTLDSTLNLNHGATFGTITFSDGRVGSKALVLNGTNGFVQLPTNVANQQEITVSAWVNWKGGNAWQRIFDFGNGETENIFLTPRTDLGQMRFAAKNGGLEQQVNTTALAVGKWTHLAITMGPNGAHLYMNGILANKSNAVTIRPIDFKPVLNYIGRSQYPDPLFNGTIDDFRIYNYALSADEVAQIAADYTSVLQPIHTESFLWVSPVPANNKLKINYEATHGHLPSTLTLHDMNGKQVILKKKTQQSSTEIDVSTIPSGIYLLTFENNRETLKQKVVIKH